MYLFKVFIIDITIGYLHILEEGIGVMHNCKRKGLFIDFVHD